MAYSANHLFNTHFWNRMWIWFESIAEQKAPLKSMCVVCNEIPQQVERLYRKALSCWASHTVKTTRSSSLSASWSSNAKKNDSLSSSIFYFLYAIVIRFEESTSHEKGRLLIFLCRISESTVGGEKGRYQTAYTVFSECEFFKTFGVWDKNETHTACTGKKGQCAIV